MDKGTRVRIARGRQGVGVAGSVFWVGENKYGDGKRLGIRGDDGETYWVNDDLVDPDEGKPPAAPEASGVELAKGTRVRWTQGGASGLGEIFWVGRSKHGPGMRYGVNSDDGETRWLDERFVEEAQGEEAGPTPAAPGGGSVGRAGDVWEEDEEDDGWIGSPWQGGEPPDLGDEPPPPEPPPGWEDEEPPL